uniref:Uncharacterized protein n=1 Tax=Fagus sylvatica TaxID=28930 RepID=A0A2N9GCU3_FAGSY
MPTDTETHRRGDKRGLGPTERGEIGDRRAGSLGPAVGVGFGYGEREKDREKRTIVGLG